MKKQSVSVLININLMTTFQIILPVLENGTKIKETENRLWW